MNKNEPADPQTAALQTMTGELRALRREVAALLASDRLAARLIRSKQADKETEEEKARALKNGAGTARKVFKGDFGKQARGTS